MFCRELFGKKPQKLEFGLQPHKIPDCDVVRTQFSVRFLKVSSDVGGNDTDTCCSSRIFKKYFHLLFVFIQ